MRLLALDMALTSVGWARWLPADPLSETPRGRIESGSFQHPGRGMQRIEAILSSVESLCHFPTTASATLPLPHLVVLEGYSYRSSGRSTVSLGELGGALRWHLHLHGIPWVAVPPAVRAKWATGKGNAGKEQVLSQAIQRLGYQGHDGDEVDALWLLQVALYRYGVEEAVVPVPKAHRSFVDKANWPAREELLQHAGA
jgi:Holliday junction resolvasome RuvABC endonuclease subunit